MIMNKMFSVLKRYVSIFSSAFVGIILAAGVLSSCAKQGGPSVDDDSLGGRIGFSAQGVAVQAMTKASVLTSLSSFYVTGTTGSAGSHVKAFQNARFVLNGEDFVGEVYWPASDPLYHFFACNVPMEFRPEGTCVWADSETDVVYAYLESPTYHKRNTLTFKHAFALLDNVEVVAAAGYSISDVNITFIPKAGGTFDIRNGYGRTDGTGWGDVVDGVSKRIASAVGDNANTVFTVPGTYTMVASWKATLTGSAYAGDTFSGMCSEVTLVGGKRNVITATLGGYAQGISFKVTVLPWDIYDIGEAAFPVGN